MKRKEKPKVVVPFDRANCLRLRIKLIMMSRFINRRTLPPEKKDPSIHLAARRDFLLLSNDRQSVGLPTCIYKNNIRL